MFGLYMPRERPRPVNWVSDEGKVTPGIERRHYFSWAVEYRELTETSGRLLNSSTATEWGKETIAGVKTSSLTVPSFW